MAEINKDAFDEFGECLVPYFVRKYDSKIGNRMGTFELQYPFDENTARLAALEVKRPSGVSKEEMTEYFRKYSTSPVSRADRLAALAMKSSREARDMRWRMGIVRMWLGKKVKAVKLFGCDNIFAPFCMFRGVDSSFNLPEGTVGIVESYLKELHSEYYEGLYDVYECEMPKFPYDNLDFRHLKALQAVKERNALLSAADADQRCRSYPFFLDRVANWISGYNGRYGERYKLLKGAHYECGFVVADLSETRSPSVRAGDQADE
jgi:hypothetical protein